MQAIIKRRIAAAIRGAFVADAASMGTHWIYDPSVMATTVSSVEAPEFRNPPSPKYYSKDEFPGHYEFGMLSPYGEQMLFVTEHVATMAMTSKDLNGGTMSEEMFQWAKTFGGRPDAAMKKFMENMETNKKPWPDCGADDHEAHVYMKIVPVVGRYAGKEELVDRAKQAIQVHQNNLQAIAFGIAAARLLEAVVLGAHLEEALKTVERNIGDDLTKAGIGADRRDEVLEAFARGQRAGTEAGKTLGDILLEVSHEMMKGREDSPFYNLAGRSCALPGSFIGPIALFYKYASSSTKDTAFAIALRENILASGDTCSRAVFIGSLMAALNESVPVNWVEKMDEGTLKRVDAAIESILSSIELVQ